MKINDNGVVVLTPLSVFDLALVAAIKRNGDVARIFYHNGSSFYASWGEITRSFFKNIEMDFLAFEDLAFKEVTGGGLGFFYEDGFDGEILLNKKMIAACFKIIFLDNKYADAFSVFLDCGYDGWHCEFFVNNKDEVFVKKILDDEKFVKKNISVLRNTSSDFYFFESNKKKLNHLAYDLIHPFIINTGKFVFGAPLRSRDGMEYVVALNSYSDDKFCFYVLP